ncbi:ubiquinol-cytochrome C chaperone family protein [Hyphomonas sp.]|uniref:ubiquinol-cytochrome C chaperone family protein n=1 Tax=Hyphomonas sp. TaxID=87 RepID=UPI00391D074E
MGIFDALFPRRAAERKAAAEAYRRLLHHALEPAHYTHLGVPDTFEGRAGMVTLLTSLALSRLRRIGGPEAAALAARLDERVLDGFDAAHRETGVGDHSIARKVRKTAQAHAGMGRALFAALDRPEDADDGLAAVLRRNGMVAAPDAGRLAAAARAMLAHLDAQPDAEILAGAFDWIIPLV